MTAGYDALRAIDDGPAGWGAHRVALVDTDVVVGGGHIRPLAVLRNRVA